MWKIRKEAAAACDKMPCPGVTTLQVKVIRQDIQRSHVQVDSLILSLIPSAFRYITFLLSFQAAALGLLEAHLADVSGEDTLKERDTAIGRLCALWTTMSGTL
jgi:hypothetical protein